MNLCIGSGVSLECIIFGIKSPASALVLLMIRKIMFWLSGGGTCWFPCVGANQLSSFMRCQRDWLEKLAVTVETRQFHSWPGEPAAVPHIHLVRCPIKVCKNFNMLWVWVLAVRRWSQLMDQEGMRPVIILAGWCQWFRSPFSALTLLVGRHEGHLACKNLLRLSLKVLFWETQPDTSWIW